MNKPINEVQTGRTKSETLIRYYQDENHKNTLINHIIFMRIKYTDKSNEQTVKTNSESKTKAKIKGFQHDESDKRKT